MSSRASLHKESHRHPWSRGSEQWRKHHRASHTGTSEWRKRARPRVLVFGSRGGPLCTPLTDHCDASMKGRGRTETKFHPCHVRSGRPWVSHSASPIPKLLTWTIRSVPLQGAGGPPRVIVGTVGNVSPSRTASRAHTKQWQLFSSRQRSLAGHLACHPGPRSDFSASTVLIQGLVSSRWALSRLPLDTASCPKELFFKVAVP